MSANVLDEVQSIQEGGVWNTDKLIPDDTWTGEVATKDEKTSDSIKARTPQTPAEEDRKIINLSISDPQLIAALTREIERKMLKEAGRSSHTSLIQQITAEREEAEKRIRDWITTQNATESVQKSGDSKSMAAKLNSINEKLVLLENKITEIMTTSATQKDAERELLFEASRIIREKHHEEIGSDQSPSEISRMDQRANELAEEVEKMRKDLPQQTAGSSSSNLKSRESAIAANRRKFGKLF